MVFLRWQQRKQTWTFSPTHALFLTLTTISFVEILGFQQLIVSKSINLHTFTINHSYRVNKPHNTVLLGSAVLSSQESVAEGESSNPGECYYRRIDGSWKPRKELSSLFIGERLFGARLPQCDLPNGTTGPKVVLECGIGRINKKGEWTIVNGMLRVGKKKMKPSVVKKKMKKIHSDSLNEVYVSKINLDNGSFEVCLSREEALEKASADRKVSASSLESGQLLSGRITNVTPYGVFVDVGANRNGLVHITKIAKHKNSYIKKEDGLKKAGFRRGSRLDVIVLSNEKKRLELDIPPVIESPNKDSLEENTATNDNIDNVSIQEAQHDDISSDEAAMWAAYASNDYDMDEKSEENDSYNDINADEAAMWDAYASNYSDDEENKDDKYDEDRDIEDALGLGYY